MKLFKPRLSARMARQLAKNLILRLDIETLIEHPDSAEAERIRDKYLAEIRQRRGKLTNNTELIS